MQALHVLARSALLIQYDITPEIVLARLPALHNDQSVQRCTKTLGVITSLAKVVRWFVCKQHYSKKVINRLQ